MSLDSSLLNDVLKKASRFLDRLELSQCSADNNSPDKDVFALRWSIHKGITPIHWQNSATLDDLLHIDRQAKLLLTNTQQFVEGLPANNTLLWGSRGTGKSSLIQSILSLFSNSGLKVIEIRQDDFSDWANIVDWLHKNKEQKFILFCDDLSFDEHDSSYKAIKAALDGSLISLPNNALIYATSNRRHLLPEKLSDNQKSTHSDGEIHHHESIEEAISLSDRFGLWLSFHALTQEQYLDIVAFWLKKYGVNEDENNYREVALRWALQRGSRSGRIANQFARSYAGESLLKTTK